MEMIQLIFSGFMTKQKKELTALTFTESPTGLHKVPQSVTICCNFNIAQLLLCLISLSSY